MVLISLYVLILTMKKHIPHLSLVVLAAAISVIGLMGLPAAENAEVDSQRVYTPDGIEYIQGI